MLFIILSFYAISFPIFAGTSNNSRSESEIAKILQVNEKEYIYNDKREELKADNITMNLIAFAT